MKIRKRKISAIWQESANFVCQVVSCHGACDPALNRWLCGVVTLWPSALATWLGIKRWAWTVEFGLSWQMSKRSYETFLFFCFVYEVLLWLPKWTGSTRTISLPIIFWEIGVLGENLVIDNNDNDGVDQEESRKRTLVMIEKRVFDEN